MTVTHQSPRRGPTVGTAAAAPVATPRRHRHRRDNLASRLPNATVQVLPGCGHNVHEDCPAQAVPLRTSFLTGVNRGMERPRSGPLGKESRATSHIAGLSRSAARIVAGAAPVADGPVDAATRSCTAGSLLAWLRHTRPASSERFDNQGGRTCS